MKKLFNIIVALLLTLSGFTQTCPTNTSCATAQNLCEADTAVWQCAPCGMGSNPEVWFEFTVNSTSPIYLNFYEIGGYPYDTIFAGYELYGPLPSMHDCSNLPTPIASSTDTAGNYFTSISSGHYLLKVDILGCADSLQGIKVFLEGGDPLVCATDSASCENCIGSFAPIPGKKYVLSAWAREDGAALTKTSFDNPEIYLDFPSASTTLGPFTPTGEIIDGWQRIEQEFIIPSNASEIKLQLKSVSGDVYFDDIRIFPFDASMKTYVYDPVNMRLAAELDERHYATYYEYDEEGKLIRVKKETVKGIMTIQETRNNASK